MMLLKIIPLEKLFKLANFKPLRNIASKNLLAFTGLKSYEVMLDINISHFARVEKKGTKVAWVPFIFPNEILTSFDIEPYTTETAALSFLEFFGTAETFDAASSLALSDDICSIQRSVYGCSVTGLFPDPDFHVRGSFCSCDSQRIAIDAMDSVKDVPSFFIDTPIGENRHSKKYLLSEIKALIDFIEDLYDTKFDKSKLAQEIKR